MNLTPIPIPDLSNHRIYEITSSFLEISDNYFQAILDENVLLSPSPNHSTLLRISRTGCHASLCVTNHHGSSLFFTHYGTYTDWECDISSLLCSNAFPLTISLKLEADEHTLSPYQKAGIFGSITLLQLPSLHFTDFYVRTVQTEQDWAFLIDCPVSSVSPQTSVSLQLETQDGCFVLEQTKSISETCDCHFYTLVPSARLWSPSNPYLYRLTISLKQNQTTIEHCEKMVGLCQIEKIDQQVFLNGHPLKLRGLAYREPLSNEPFDSAADLVLFREANVNYLRSLYYPFSERFLSLCDEAGILVEQSAAIDGVGQTLPANQNAPALRPLFLNQYREMVLRDRSHPSILLWSLGNDSVWGDQFRQGLTLIKTLDPNRLVNFHLPMTIPQNDWIPDVWSMQHSAWNLETDVCYDQMVIFHTHGADNPIGYAVGQAQDYTLPVLHDAYALVPVYDRDALDKEDGIHEFWGESLSRFWNNIRNTEGALGGAIMAAVDETEHFHPSLKDYCYGILDKNHQPKPEYWHVKMAYQEDPFTITKYSNQWLIKNSNITCSLNPQTGLFTNLSINHKPVLCGGPFLHTGRFRLDPWQLTSLNAELDEKSVVFTISGHYGEICAVTFYLTLSEYGELTTSCTLNSVNRPMPHTVKSGIGLDPGGLDEFGLSFLLPSDMDTLSWSRYALWNRYPSNHIGRPQGTAHKENRSDFCSLKADIIDATISSADTNIHLYPLTGQSLRLALTADPHCILDDREKENTLAHLHWDGRWYPVDDKAGLINSTETMAHDANASCCIRFCGTGVTIYGTTDRIRGCCDIWLDDKLYASNLSQHTPAVQFPAMSRGYEKRYHQVLCSIQDLPYGNHTCRIVVTGTKEPMSQETWISIDSIEIEHPDYPKQVSMILCQDYNYPRLTQGNYMRPAVMIRSHDIVTCELSFEEKED